MDNPMLVENNVFSEADFKSPEGIYAPTYNWIWNGPLNHEEIDGQLCEFQRLGIKSFCIVPEPRDFRPNSMPTLLTPDYLTDAYFEQYSYALSRAKSKGMYAWIYDEGGWPSGGACGKVMLMHPEYARRCLDVRTLHLRCGDSYAPTSDVLEAYVGDMEISNGYRAEKDCKVSEYYERVIDSGSPQYPDITRKETADCFIEVTHRGYKSCMGELFGSTALAVFTDEPKGPAPVPFRAELEEIFLRENGYSIRKFLPWLLRDGDLPREAAQARIAWLDMCSRELCRNYFLTEKEWSNKNGLLYTGHVGGDHSTECGFASRGYYHLMRVLRCFDIPGIDAIWRQIYPTYINNGRDETCRNNGIFPRFASSAAAQVSSRRAMTESMGVYGAGVTFNDMRYVLGYQAVRGINTFNIFGIPYSRRGFHMTGEMPFFTEKHACYRDLPSFNLYAERLSYLASLGERVADVGYYMPVRDMWCQGKLGECARNFEELGRQLEDENILFDVIDDDVLACSCESASGGVISMGKGRYSTVIIPKCRYMPKESLDVLSRFICGGGRAIIVSDSEIEGLCGAEVSEDIKGILPKALELSGDTEKIRLGVRQADNGRLYILFNESDGEKTFSVCGQKKFARLYAESSRICTPSAEVITLQSGESAFLFDGDVCGERETVFENHLTLSGFTFRRSDRFVIGEDDFILEQIDEAAREISLGDWSDMVGRDFSGSGVYRAEFKRPKEDGPIRIDLGEVRYSCEVILNGTSLGASVMSPYRIDISARELSENNVLEIRVSNTAANEYESTASFDKWEEWQLSTYHKTQKLYHSDSLSGGLIGPVKIEY